MHPGFQPVRKKGGEKPMANIQNVILNNIKNLMASSGSTVSFEKKLITLKSQQNCIGKFSVKLKTVIYVTCSILQQK